MKWPASVPRVIPLKQRKVGYSCISLPQKTRRLYLSVWKLFFRKSHFGILGKTKLEVREKRDSSVTDVLSNDIVL